MADLLVRKIPLPYAGDAWAQPGAQSAITASGSNVGVICTGRPLRFYCVAVTNGAPANGDASTVDTVAVKVTDDAYGNTVLRRCVTLREHEGAEVIVGEDITEEDVDEGDLVYLGFVSVTADAADAIWLYVSHGATPA